MAKSVMQKRTIRYAHIAKDGKDGTPGKDLTYKDFVAAGGIATLGDAVKADATFKTNVKDALKADTDFKTSVKGDPGTSVTVSSTKVEYASSTSGTTPPTTGWSTSIQGTIAAGSYLWTRTTTTFSDGKTAVSYVCARQGVNGTTPKYSDFSASLINDLKANEDLKASLCTAIKADAAFCTDIKTLLADDDNFKTSVATSGFSFDNATGVLKLNLANGDYVNINFKTQSYQMCAKQMCYNPVAFGK